MTDEELREIAKMANDLRDLNHLLAILEGANRLAQEINAVIKTLEENGGDDIGFDNT